MGFYSFLIYLATNCYYFEDANCKMNVNLKHRKTFWLMGTIWIFARCSLQLWYNLMFYPSSLHTLVSLCTGAKTAQHQSGSEPKEFSAK